MSQLPDPPHIKKAKQQLWQLGLPDAALPHLMAALDLASAAYYDTPQAARGEQMRKERDRVQDELETVSSQLVQERRKSEKLADQLASLTARVQELNNPSNEAVEPSSPFGKRPSIIRNLRAENGALRGVITQLRADGANTISKADLASATANLRKELDQAKGIYRVGPHVLSLNSLLKSLRGIVKHSATEPEYALLLLARTVENAEAVRNGNEPGDWDNKPQMMAQVA